MFYLTSLVIPSIVSGCVLFAIMEALYERKYLNKRLCYWGALLVYVILSSIVAKYKWPGVNLLFTMLILCSMSCLLYKTSKRSVVINSAIVIAYFALIDLIITTVLSVFTDVNIYIALGDLRFFLISGICYMLAMLCTYNLLIQLIMRSQVEKASKHIHFYTVFLLIFELGILCFLLDNYMGSINNIVLLVLATGFIVVDGGVLYLFKMFSKNAILEKQTKLAEQQCAMTVKYYEGMQSQYEEMQRLIHDFKKHIQVIENLEENQKEIRRKYIGELMVSINSIQHQFKCEDEIVCTVIWEKIQICKQEGITLALNLQDIKFDFMGKSEVTSLFANLLDNAVEACRDSGKEKKEIRLRVHSFKGYIVIGMRNTIGSAPLFKKGHLQSAKSGHLGMGMTILSNIAEKYCGNVDFNYSDEYFNTKIIIAARNTI